MGLQLGSRNLSFMTFSTQLQDSTKLFSHIFHLFHLFLELQNLVVFKKVIYKITNVLSSVESAFDLPKELQNLLYFPPRE